MNNIIVNSKILLKALTYANKVMAKNPSVPILENFLFDVKGNRLTVSGSDLQSTLKLSLDVQTVGDENFQVCVPAEIMKYLQKVDETLIIISADQTTKIEKFWDNETRANTKEKEVVTYSVEVLQETTRAKYSGENPVDFPKAPQTNFDFIETDSSLFTEFKDLLNYTSNDELRPAMTGIYFGTHKGNFELSATDGHRLKIVTIPEFSDPTEQSEEGKQHFILPAKAAKILSDLKFGTSKKPENALVKIKVLDIEKEQDRTNISFHFILDSFEVEFIVRNIDERFPQYWNVIPTEIKTRFIIQKNEIVKQIDKALLFANKTTHQIKIKLNGVNQISSEDLDFSNEYCANLNGSYEGEPIEIGFNGEFLNECLQSCGDMVALDLIAPNKAGVLRSENSLVLCMPVMLAQYA